jgi:hypothetical protein
VLVTHYRVDETSVRTFYSHQSPPQKPPDSLIRIIRQINTGAEGRSAGLTAAGGTCILGHYRMESYSCSVLLAYVANLSFPKEKRLEPGVLSGPFDPVGLAQYALRASVQGEMEVQLSNTGVGTAKDIEVSGPIGVHGREKVVSLDRGMTAIYRLEVKGDGRQPLGLLDYQPSPGDFSATWRSEASSRTIQITYFVAAALFIILLLTVLADIRRTSLKQSPSESGEE